ncbi:MAG: glycosyltransferase family 4 protein [Patescibacteria group bacterium]
MDHPRVLMIGWEYPPHNSGGLGVACQGMTAALAGQNTQIYFTLPYQFAGQVGHMKMIGCYDKSWQSKQSPPFDAYHPGNRRKLDKSEIDAFDLEALDRCEIEQKVFDYAKIVEKKAKKIKHDFDVVHAHDWMSFPAAARIKKNMNKPFVAHVHSTEFDRVPSGNGSAFITKIEQEGLKLADEIIAVSYYTKRLLVEKYHLDESRIHVVHNGIEKIGSSFSEERMSFAKKRPVVVFMGRLTMQKGIDHLLKTASKVVSMIPETLFVIAGSGHLYHELLFQTAGQKLSATVLFSGFVRDEQKAKLLDRADVFIMPSVSEPFGLVALEAAQRHTPVVLSKTSGVSEVMPAAIAVDFWDIELMSKKVVELLEDRGYRAEVTAGQLNDLKKMEWNRATARIRQVYRRAFLSN